MTRLHELTEHGQSMWLDSIHRSLMSSGDLQNLIDQGLRGMTSNPAIFDKAFSDSDEYDDQLRELLTQPSDEPPSTYAIYEALAIQDIQTAADILRPIYEATDGLDGYISLEANPHLANDAQGTIDEVRHLRAAVDRPNVMYKIPATASGIIAIEQLLSEGTNINITLMFSPAHYEAVAQAYVAGLAKLALSGGDVSRVASVASFFLSRIDSKLDDWFDKMGETQLQGKIALANAKLVYQRFTEIFSSPYWQPFADAGAKPQRLLWASTSTKNPDYPDTMYVDNLIGPYTVNTVPTETLEAFMDHGTAAATVEQGLDEARQTMERLEALDIDINEIGERLQREGIDKFKAPFDSMIGSLEKRRQQFKQRIESGR